MFPWNRFPTHRTFHIVRIPSVILRILKKNVVQKSLSQHGTSEAQYFLCAISKEIMPIAEVSDLSPIDV